MVCIISLINACSFGIVSFAKLMCQSSHGWLRMNDTAGVQLKFVKQGISFIIAAGFGPSTVWSALKRVPTPITNHASYKRNAPGHIWPNLLKQQILWRPISRSLTTSQIGSLAAKSFLRQKCMQLSAIWVAKTGLWLQESKNKHFKRDKKIAITAISQGTSLTCAHQNNSLAPTSTM